MGGGGGEKEGWTKQSPPSAGGGNASPIPPVVSPPQRLPAPRPARGSARRAAGAAGTMQTREAPATSGARRRRLGARPARRPRVRARPPAAQRRRRRRGAVSGSRRACPDAVHAAGRTPRPLSAGRQLLQAPLRHYYYHYYTPFCTLAARGDSSGVGVGGLPARTAPARETAPWKEELRVPGCQEQLLLPRRAVPGPPAAPRARGGC